MLNIYVLHYKDDGLTCRCVETLLADGWIYDHCPIYIIDNGSPVQFRRLSEWRGVEVLRAEDNEHLIPAFNRAMQQTPGFAYWCLNNDVFPLIGTAQILYDAFGNSELGIIAPGSSDKSAGILYAPKPEPGIVLKTNHVDNHAWAFTQDLVDAIGWPDAVKHPHRANWYANRLYCWKARKANYGVACIRGGWVNHEHKGGYDAEADALGYQWLIERLRENVEEAL